MSFLRWSKRPSRMDVGCVAEPYDEQTEQAQKDLLVVVEYLAERTSGVGASGEDITQAAHICSLPFHSLTEPKRVEVWQFLNRLCRLIAPATVEGLRAAGHKHTSRYGWSALFLGVIVTFILAILLQAYALFGTQTLNRLNQLNKEAQTVFDQINALEQRQPNLYKFGIILDKRGGEAGSATEERRS